MEGNDVAIGALLQREGLRSSHLARRRQYRDCGLTVLSVNTQGREAKERNPLEAHVQQLEKKILQADQRHLDQSARHDRNRMRQRAHPRRGQYGVFRQHACLGLVGSFRVELR